MKCSKFLQLCPNHDNYSALLNLLINGHDRQTQFTQLQSKNPQTWRLCIIQVIRHNPSNVTLKMWILKIETILRMLQLGNPFVANYVSSRSYLNLISTSFVALLSNHSILYNTADIPQGSQFLKTSV